MSNTLINKNDIIAVFMAAYVTSEGLFKFDKIPFNGESSAWTACAEDLFYHIKYDWLMRVVDRIEQMSLKTKYDEYTGFRVVISENQCTIYCQQKNRQDGVIYQTPYGKMPSSKIEAIYLGVVAFIEWFNKERISTPIF